MKLRFSEATRLLVSQMNRMNEEQELPQGWAWARLGEIASTSSGGTPSRSNPSYFTGNIPWIKSGELGDGYVTEHSESISEAALADSSAKLFPKGTLLIALYGATVGKVGILTMDAATNQAVCGIFLPPWVELKFAFNYLFSLRREFIEQGKGGAQPNISQDIVRNTPFPLPPLPEQRRIVAKLEELFSKLDAGVAAVRRTQALLKRYRQSVLHAAVTGELTRAWRETHPAAPAETGAALLQRIRTERRAQWEAAQVAKRGGQLPLGEGWKAKYVEPEALDTEGLPELPEGWAWATSEQLCSSVASGSTPKPEELFADKGEIPFLKVYNLTKTGHLDFTNKPTFIREQIHNGQLNRSRVNPGDVLINIVGPPLGKVSIVPDQFSEWNINQAIVAFKAVPGYSNKFLLTSLLTETIMNWLLRTAKTTTSQVNLSVTVCRQLPLPLPSEAEQAEIVAEVERRLTVLDALSQTLTDELKRAERLRQSILHQAFTGRLVPQDATDEPAAALLARLRETAIQPKTRKTKETTAAPAKEKKPRGRKPADATQIDFSFTGE